MKWLRKTKRPSRRDRGIDAEMEFHLTALIEANRQNGIGENEARRTALVAFGGREQIRQQVREAHLSSLLDLLGRNFAAAWRFAKRYPGMTGSIVLILALGIGASTAVFSALDAVLLQPLPFPQGDQLVELRQHDIRVKGAETTVAPLRVEDWNRLSHSFEAISGWYTQGSSEISGALPEKVTEAIVAPRFFQVWGMAPALGRDFTQAEEHFGGPDAVVLSDRYWRRRFGADPSVLNKRVRIGGITYSVVGVMPASFHFVDQDVDLWLPNAPDAPYSQDRMSTWFITVGRIKPGISLATAQADVTRVQGALCRLYPRSDGNLAVWVEPLKQVVLHGIASSLWLLYGAVSLLLIVACVNIAALLMARTAEREAEMAVRYALGASRVSIVLQLLSEVLLPACAGATLGLVLAAGAVHLFHVFAKDLPRVQEIALSWRVAIYTLVSIVGVTLASGLLPALRGSRREVASGLAQNARVQVSGGPSLQWTLVGTQVAMAAALLVGAGLLVRSMDAMGRVALGFHAEHVLTLRISAGWGETVNLGALHQRIARDLDALRSVPGVEAVAIDAELPGMSGSQQQQIDLDGTDHPGASRIYADTRFISSGYFAVMGIRRLAGELCRDDLPYATAMVNRTFAQLYLAGAAVPGHQLQFGATGSSAPSVQLRGVVADAREAGANQPVSPTVYLCANDPDPDPWFLLRVYGDPAALAPALRRKMAQVEPSRSVYAVMPLRQRLADQSANDRARTALLSMFAVAAVALVCLGLYGTVSYTARTRRREIGLRLALGAMPRRILRSFLLQSLRVSLLGSIVGLLGGAAFSRLLAGMLYGVSALDPWVYGGVAAMLLVVSALATLFPALCAVTISMVEALRES